MLILLVCIIMPSTRRAFVGNKNHTETGRPPIYLQGELCITASSTIVRIYHLCFQGNKGQEVKQYPRLNRTFYLQKYSLIPFISLELAPVMLTAQRKLHTLLGPSKPTRKCLIRFRCSWFFNKNTFFAMTESILIGSRNQILSQRWSFATTMVIWKN